MSSGPVRGRRIIVLAVVVGAAALAGALALRGRTSPAVEPQAGEPAPSSPTSSSGPVPPALPE